jgi:hypothetical protein
MVSQEVTDIVVAASLGLVVLLLLGLAYAARAERNRNVLLVGGAVAIAWYVATFALVKSGAYASDPQTTFPAIGLAIAVPVILGGFAIALDPVRRAVGQIGLPWLVGVQFYRVVGGIFLIAYFQDDIPGEFAIPAGVGDMLVGITAPFVAIYLARAGAQRAWPVVTAWCALGIADLAIAVGTGFFSAPSSFQQLASADPNFAITRYPLALIPAFAVPVSIILHIWVLALLAPQRKPAVTPRIA